MNAAASIAAPNAAGTPAGVQGGLFGAPAGAQAQAHGPMAGFEALLAAFFGDQGQTDSLGLGAQPTDPTKAATASKPGSKAGTMDDALTPALEAGPASDDKTQTSDPTATTTQTGVPADAQALAALLAAAGATRVDTPPQTSGQAPAAGDTATAADAAAKVPPGFDKGLGLKVGLERRFGDPAAATDGTDGANAETTTDPTAAATDAKPGEAASSKARLIELAQQLAAGRRPNAKLAEAGQAKPYTPAGAPANGQTPATASAATAAADAAQLQAQTDAQADTGQPADPAAAAQAALAEAAQQAATPTSKPAPGVRTGQFDASRKGGEATNALTAAPAADGAAKTASAIAGFTGKTADSDDAAKPDAKDEVKVEAASSAPPKSEAPDDLAPAQTQAAPQHQAPAATHAVATAVRGAPETVASLAAQIIKKLDGRSTRFDVQLHPAELGRVDVRLEIGATGKLTASMSFDNPQAAADLRSRSDELQRALENAGFDLSGGLSFDVAGDSGGNGQNQAQQNTPDGGGALRGRAFESALATAGESAGAALAGALNAYQTRTAPGLDIRI